MKKSFLCLLVCTSLFCTEQEYLWHQAYHDVGGTIALLNTNRVQNLIKEISAQNLPNAPWYEWHTRAEWLGISFPYIQTLLQAFDSLNQANTPHRALRKFLVDSVMTGPTFPHFYDENGDYWFKNDVDFAAFLQIPYFLQDFNTILDPTSKAYKLIQGFTNPSNIALPTIYGIPIAKECPTIDSKGKTTKGSYVAFNQITWAYDAIKKPVNLPKKLWRQTYTMTLTPDLFPAQNASVGAFSSYYTLNSLGALGITKKCECFERFCTPETLGFEALGLMQKAPLAIAVPANQAYGDTSFFNFKNQKVQLQEPLYAPAGTGIAKLLLLRLGINKKNEMIEKNDLVLYPVYQDLTTLMNSAPDKNPWSDAYLSLDNFLLYHIAELLKKDKKLYDQAYELIDFSFLKFRRNYETFLLDIKGEHDQEVKRYFRNPNGTNRYKYEDIKVFLLGKEQYFAYCILKLARLAWYGILDENAFYRATYQKPNAPADQTWDSFWQGATFVEEIDDEFVSFITFWQTILSRLPRRSHWFCCDDHCWTLSTLPSLLTAQGQNLSSESQKKLSQLGFAGIDSIFSYAPEKSFFKRNRRDDPQALQLQEQRDLIAETLDLLVQLKKNPQTAGTAQQVLRKVSPQIIEINRLNNQGTILSNEQKNNLVNIKAQVLASALQSRTTKKA